MYEEYKVNRDALYKVGC